MRAKKGEASAVLREATWRGGFYDASTNMEVYQLVDSCTPANVQAGTQPPGMLPIPHVNLRGFVQRAGYPNGHGWSAFVCKDDAICHVGYFRDVTVAMGAVEEAVAMGVAKLRIEAAQKAAKREEIAAMTPEQKSAYERVRDILARAIRGIVSYDEAAEALYAIVKEAELRQPPKSPEEEERARIMKEQNVVTFESALRLAEADEEAVGGDELDVWFPPEPFGHIAHASLQSLADDGIEIQIMDIPTKEGTAIDCIIIEPKVKPIYGHRPKLTIVGRDDEVATNDAIE